MNVPYQVGETVDITLRGARVTGTGGGTYLDIETADGEEMCIIYPAAESVEITRRLPGGDVQPGDVWEDSRNNRWFAVLIDQRYGAAVVKLTRDGLNTLAVETVHQDYVLAKRLFRAEPTPDHGLSEAADAELAAAVDGGQ